MDGSAINNISVQEYELTPVAVSAFDKATLEKLHAAGITDVSGVSASNPVTVKSKSLVAPSLQPSQSPRSQPSSVASSQPTFAALSGATFYPTLAPTIQSLSAQQSFAPSASPSTSSSPNHLGSTPSTFSPGFFSRCHSSSRFVSPLHHLSDKFTNYN